MSKVTQMRDFRASSKDTPEEKEAQRRRLIRVAKTPAAKLPAAVDALTRFCLSKLQEGFAANGMSMTAWVELTEVYPLDVIEGVKARFEKAGNDWKVEYSHNDYPPTYDHLGFSLPIDWIDRLLKA